MNEEVGFIGYYFCDHIYIPIGVIWELTKKTQVR